MANDKAMEIEEISTTCLIAQDEKVEREVIYSVIETFINDDDDLFIAFKELHEEFEKAYAKNLALKIKIESLSKVITSLQKEKDGFLN